MLAVPGLRRDKVLKGCKALGITSLAELERAAREDRIRTTKGLGASLQTKILAKHGPRQARRVPAAHAPADALLRNALKRWDGCSPISSASRLRAICAKVLSWSPTLRWWRKRGVLRMAQQVCMAFEIGRSFCAHPAHPCKVRDN